MSFRDRLFRLVIRLYPGDFRDRFGDDMQAAYREMRMDAAMRGRRGVVEFWLGVVVDALVRAPGQHMRMTWHDLRFAARALRRTPVFTLVAIATLALGIGANTAIFSVVHAVALKPLATRDPQRLVRIWEKNEKLKIPRFSASVPNYYDWAQRVRSFEGMATWRSDGATLTAGGDPQRLSKIEATASLLPLLGIQPLAGRVFTADEDRPGAQRVAIFTEGVWRGRLGGNSDIIGKPIALDGVPYTVIGIVSERDIPIPFPVDVIVPLAADLSKESRSNHLMSVVARLRNGATIDQAQKEMDGIAAQLAREYPKDDAGWGVTMATFYDWIVPESIRTGLYLLLSSVGLVLLIACTNIANLTLARAAVRRREQAVRLALGASRGRVVREVLTESVLLSVVGGAAGIAVAYWAVPVFRSQLATVLPRADGIALSAPVLAFAFVVSIVTGLLFGALPAILNSRRDVVTALKDTSRGATSQGHVRRLLVVGQLALATLLLAGAALLVQSFIRLQRVDLGFQPTRVTTARVALSLDRYPERPARWLFFWRLVKQLEGIAGIDAVGFSSGPPLSGGSTAQPARAQGPNALGTNELQADWRVVSPAYFKAMGIPVLRGREFAEGDTGVVILSADMARRFWPNEDPIGRTILLPSPFRVVGVAGDVRNLNRAQDPRPTMYLAATQFAPVVTTLVIRSKSDEPVAAIVRKTVSSMDPQLAVFGVRTMETLLENDSAQARVTAWLVGMFAGLALLLAAIGVYGVLAYLVAQQTRDIGVRLALGARPGSVLRLVVGHSLRLSSVGIAIGALGAILAAPWLRSQLFGVEPRDPRTLIGVSLVLLAIAILASYVPARRATRVDPLTALRAE